MVLCVQSNRLRCLFSSSLNFVLHSNSHSTLLLPSPSIMLGELNHRIDTYSSRRSLHNGNSYGDLVSHYGTLSIDTVFFQRRSTSRDPLRSDSMLGTLNSDTLSSKHGVSTIPKGDCAYCSKPIIGQVPTNPHYKRNSVRKISPNLVVA